MKEITPARVEITIRRPDGTVETKAHPNLQRLTDYMFAQIVEGTRKAGRGECLSYRNVEAVTEAEEADYHVHCDRCHADLDSRSAYRQAEKYNFNGKILPCNAYYCEDCRRYLSSVGQGELTDLEARAGDRPSFEPSTKADY